MITEILVEVLNKSIKAIAETESFCEITYTDVKFLCTLWDIAETMVEAHGLTGCCRVASDNRSDQPLYKQEPGQLSSLPKIVLI